MNKTKIYQIKHGYNVLASFDSIDKATAFFGDLVKQGARKLVSVSGKGENSDKKAHYWGGDVELAIRIVDVTVYPSKKEAEFAVFENGEGDTEDLS